MKPSMERCAVGSVTFRSKSKAAGAGKYFCFLEMARNLKLAYGSRKNVNSVKCSK